MAVSHSPVSFSFASTSNKLNHAVTVVAINLEMDCLDPILLLHGFKLSAARQQAHKNPQRMTSKARILSSAQQYNNCTLLCTSRSFTCLRIATPIPIVMCWCVMRILFFTPVSQQVINRLIFEVIDSFMFAYVPINHNEMKNVKCVLLLEHCEKFLRGLAVGKCS